MSYLTKTNERGMSHVIMVVLGVVVLGVIGFAGWRVMEANKDKTSSNSTVSADTAKVVAAECKKEIDDKDLCKFFSTFGSSTKWAIASTDTQSDGTVTASTFVIDGENTHMTMSGYEVISINKTTYTKAGDTWWKQTTPTTPTTDVPSTDSSDYKFDEPTTDTTSSPTYTLVGKEACGSLTCFKYKVVDPDNATSTEFIWFDDAKYLARRSLTEGADGSKTDVTYTYEGIAVTEPSPVKELGANQYIIPGQTEPTTIPAL